MAIPKWKGQEIKFISPRLMVPSSSKMLFARLSISLISSEMTHLNLLVVRDFTFLKTRAIKGKLVFFRKLMSEFKAGIPKPFSAVVTSSEAPSSQVTHQGDPTNTQKPCNRSPLLTCLLCSGSNPTSHSDFPVTQHRAPALRRLVSSLSLQIPLFKPVSVL